jgi:exosome complex RNA-binding protein Rrp42 (RNase PH superfamily)
VPIYSNVFSVKLPHVSYDAETETTVVSAEKRSELQVHSTPVATTYAIFDEYVVLSYHSGILCACA